MEATALNVLVVEDDDDNRELLAELLRMEGHEVVAVASGEEALLRVAERPFDAVLADVGLPGMDGLALARALRARLPRLAIVAVSGWGDGADLAAARGRELDGVLVKPAEPRRLAAVLAAAVKARRGGGGAA